MELQNVLVDDRSSVCTVTVNRPQVLNALDETTLRELAFVFERLAADSSIRCVILTGAGDRAFVAGADIAALSRMGPREARQVAALGHRLGALMEGLRVPIIAAINGFALGGGLELALLCDFAFASSRARLGMPEVTLGVVPGFGGTQRLARRVGPGHARQMLFSGTLIDAAEALRLGLVNAVFPPEALMSEARACAETIAARAPLAVAEAKRALALGLDVPLAQGLALEQEIFGSLFATRDQKEGMTAFLEKRPPKFQGS